LPVLRRLPGVEVAAICDNDVSKAQALAARFEVKDTYDDIEEVLRYANVDVVVICTPITCTKSTLRRHWPPECMCCASGRWR